MNAHLNDFLAERKVKKAPDNFTNFDRQIENAKKRLAEYKHEREVISKQVAKLTNNDQKIQMTRDLIDLRDKIFDLTRANKIKTGQQVANEKMLEASTETGEAPSGQNKFQDMLAEMKVV